MIRTKSLLAIALVVILLVAALTSGGILFAYAENVETDVPKFETTENTEATPYGLFTNLTLSIDGGNGQVWATAKNKFTLFSASIPVVVEIYSSDTYQESYKDMTLESRNYINNLKMGQTVTATASTNGQQKYWKGRMYFNIDNKGWEEEVTSTWLCDANGFPVL